MRFRLQKWYFYFCAAFTLYGRMGRHFYLASLAEKGHFFVDETTNFARIMTWVIVHHSFISYSLYMSGFVTFVLLLRKGLFKYQFSQFAWTHITIAIIFLQSSATISNIFEGMIWFLFPFLLVVVNDVMAYVFGKAFGRTPLIARRRRGKVSSVPCFAPSPWHRFYPRFSGNSDFSRVLP